MKRTLIYILVSLVIVVLSTPIAVAQSGEPASGEEETVDTTAIPDLEADADLKESRWDLDRLFDDALAQIPAFLSGVPEQINKVSVVRIDGDEKIYVNTVSLKYKLQDALMKHSDLTVVECLQCNNMKVYVEDESLILSRAAESNEALRRLGNELGIDAYIQGVVTINEAFGKIQLNLQMVDIEDGTILKSTALKSFYSEKPEEELTVEASLQAKREEMYETDLDLEALFPRLLERLPLHLGDLPQNIQKIAIGNIQGDDIYFVDTSRLRNLFENTLVNQTDIKVVECIMCSAQEYYSLRDAAVYPDSAATAKRMKMLSEQLGFDAYISSNVKIHEDEEKLELNLKVVNMEDSTIVKTVSLTTTDDDIEEDSSEHSLTFLPYAAFTLEGDASVNDDNEAVSGTMKSMLGLQYRFVTTTIIDNLLIGFDYEYFVHNSNETDDGIRAELQLLNLILKYRLPFEFAGYRAFNAAFGYGSGSIKATTQNDYDEDAGLSSTIKLEGDMLITPSLSAGLGFYMLGSAEIEFDEEDCDGKKLKQDFAGNSLALYIRLTF